MTDTYRIFLESELDKYNSRLARIEKEISLAQHDIKPTWEQLKELYNTKKSRAEFQLENAQQPLFI